MFFQKIFCKDVISIFNKRIVYHRLKVAGVAHIIRGIVESSLLLIEYVDVYICVTRSN